MLCNTDNKWRLSQYKGYSHCINWKFTLEQPTKTHRGSRDSCTFFILDARWGRVVNATLRPLYPREGPDNHCTGGWVGHSGGLDGCGKYCPPAGFDPRPVQPVAGRHTDWAIPAHHHLCVQSFINFIFVWLTLVPRYCSIKTIHSLLPLPYLWCYNPGLA